MAESLHRSVDDRMLAGVAAGVAETLDADPSLVRIVWALLAILTGGIAILVYIVMAIVVPEGPAQPWPPAASAPAVDAPPGGADQAPPTTSAPDSAPTWPAPAPMDRGAWRAARRESRPARRRQAIDSGEAGLIFGVLLIVIGALFLVREAIPWFDFHVWWPIGIIGLGLLLLVTAIRPGGPRP
jgi:phage shock protein C